MCDDECISRFDDGARPAPRQNRASVLARSLLTVGSMQKSQAKSAALPDPRSSGRVVRFAVAKQTSAPAGERQSDRECPHGDKGELLCGARDVPAFVLEQACGEGSNRRSETSLNSERSLKQREHDVARRLLGVVESRRGQRGRLSA
jgi:hypothetical protein